jgi:hypothetical protein
VKWEVLLFRWGMPSVFERHLRVIGGDMTHLLVPKFHARKFNLFVFHFTRKNASSRFNAHTFWSYAIVARSLQSPYHICIFIFLHQSNIHHFNSWYFSGYIREKESSYFSVAVRSKYVWSCIAWKTLGIFLHDRWKDVYVFCCCIYGSHFIKRPLF